MTTVEGRLEGGRGVTPQSEGEGDKPPATPTASRAGGTTEGQPLVRERVRAAPELTITLLLKGVVDTWPLRISSNLTMSLDGLYPLKTAGLGLRKSYFPVTLAGLAGTAKVVDNYTFDCNGRITAIDFVTTVPASTASKAATITPVLDGTAITGGVLALTTALATAGADYCRRTPITALNTFTPTTLV